MSKAQRPQRSFSFSIGELPLKVRKERKVQQSARKDRSGLIGVRGLFRCCVGRWVDRPGVACCFLLMNESWTRVV
jgi:hypothetical protein